MTNLRCSPARARFMRAQPHRLLHVRAGYSIIKTTKLLAKAVLDSVLASSAKSLSRNQGMPGDLVWSFEVGFSQSLD